MSNSYSYSQLQAAYRCNTYYKLLYIDKMATVAAKSADLVFGSSFHFALEEFFTDKASLTDSFKVYWSNEAVKLEYGRYNQASLELTAEILLPRFERLYAKKIQVHQQEVRLYGFLPSSTSSPSGGDLVQTRLEGTPDLIGNYEGTPSVIDFKTSSYRYPKEKVFLNEQMYLYAHLAKQNGFEALQVVYIVFIKGNTPSIQVLKREITQEEMKKVLANISAQCQTLDMIREKNVWSYNSNSCLMGNRKCDFFNHCWKDKK